MLSPPMLFLAALLLFSASPTESFSSRPARRVINREELPTLESPTPLSPPKGVSSKDFYPPTYTLLRAGPVPTIRRVIDPKKYENLVYKYIADFKDDSLMTAQGNADAFLASPGKFGPVKDKFVPKVASSLVFSHNIICTILSSFMLLSPSLQTIGQNKRC